MNFRSRSVVTCISSLPVVVGVNRMILSLTALSLVLTGSSPADAAAALISNPESLSRPEEEIHLRYRIEEEVPRGTIVGNVVNDANLRSRYSNDAMQQIRFRFLADYSSVGGGTVATAVSTGGGAIGASSSGSGTPSIAPSGLFEIGPSSGLVRTASDLDRDSPSMCRQRRLCELNIDIVILPVQYFRILKVTVEIVDINDNAPRFRDPEIVLSINEAAQPGSLYPLPTAIDWDSPDQNGVQRYELDSPSPLADKFTLHVGTKLDGSAEIKLHLRDRLDREATAEYRLRLVAYDGGSKSGAATLVIGVADSNDNRPEFTSSGTSGAIGNAQYDFTVVENLPVGSVVGRVKAIDRDAGANGLVFYEIPGTSTGGSPSSSGSQGRPSSSTSSGSLSSMPFFVKNTTGEIIVRGIIDRETTAIHRFTIAARDNGPDQLSAEASIIIHVEDLNDNAPAVTIHTLVASPPSSSSGGAASTSVVAAEISEDSPSGSFVAYVSAIDPDDGSNGRVDCELVHAGSGGASADAASSTFSLTQKYENEYQIVTAAALDRERRAEYMVAVRCRDNGSPSARIGEKTVRITVTDVNDNPPVFSQQTYRGSLVENNVIGISVLQVTATDWDSGNNGRVQYSIPGTVSQMFHIDQQGVISVHAVVDRERYDSFRFPILAVDRGTSPSPLTGSALVVISIEDVDDERPRFLQPHYVFGVYENEPIGTEIGSVLAEDRDGPPFNSFRYSFQAGDPLSEESFSVDSLSGAVSLRLPLDRERRPQYRFTIIAYDPKSYVSVSLQPSGTATVTVNVLDRNDNTPFFVTPPENVTTTVQVSGQAPIGHVITTVSARDSDIDENGRIIYSLRRSATGTGNDGDRSGSVRVVEVGSDTSGLFRVDAMTGAIVIDKILLPVSGGTFPVVVVATDAGEPPLSTSTTINVFVNRSLPFVFSDGHSGSSSTMTASSYGYNARMTTFNLVIIVAIVSGCSVVVFVLIVAIALVRHRDFRRRHARKYNCRMEALRMITSGSEGHPPETAPKIGVTLTSPSGTPSKRISNGSLVTSCNPELSTSIKNLASEPSGSVGYHSSTSVNEQVNHNGATSSKFGNGNVSADSGADQDSVHSVEGDGSVTDSGRGPSEEGEGGVNALVTTSSLSGIGVSGGYTSSGAGNGRPQRERVVPPPPPPPRPGAAYWAQHHQNQPQQQPAILVGGHYAHHHRAPTQNYPTVRFHGLSTTIPEDEMLGDCCSATDDGAGLSEKQSNSSLSLSSAMLSGRSARQPGRRAALVTAATPNGTRANCVTRLPGHHSARMHSNTSPSGTASNEAEAQALLHVRNSSSSQNESENRSQPGSDELLSSPRQTNGCTNAANNEGTVGWTYLGSSVIV